MNMNFIFLPRPQDDEIVMSYLGGSRLFPALVKPDSDFDVFTVTGRYYEGWLANLNLSLSERHLFDVYLPDEFIKITSEHWRQLVSHRDELLTRPRLTRVTRSFALRIELTQGLHGKQLAEQIKRAWQLTALVNRADIYTMPTEISDVLVAIRGSDSDADEQAASALLNRLHLDLKSADLSAFPEDDVEVRLV